MNFEDTMVDSKERAGQAAGKNSQNSGSDPMLQDFQTYEDTSLSTHLLNTGEQDQEMPDDYSSNIFQINQVDLNRMQHFGCK